MNKQTVYVNLRELTEVHTRTVHLKDVAEVYCANPKLQNRCASLVVKTIRDQRPHRYVEDVLAVIQSLEALDPAIEVNNIGKVEYIIAYQPPKKPHRIWQWIKTFAVCVVCFCGAAFAIMTFNNDVSATDVFSELYLLVMGRESTGFTILELSYSLGLGVGILVFFNHFAGWKLNTDPTPLEVEMRLYEENISKTLIQNQERREQEVDIR